MYGNRIDLGFPMALVEFLARVGSVISITLLVLLFQAEALHPSQIAPREWFGLVFFPIGVIAGLAIAWWKEGLGVSITLGSLLAFYFVYGYLLQYHLGSLRTERTDSFSPGDLQNIATAMMLSYWPCLVAVCPLLMKSRKR